MLQRYRKGAGDFITATGYLKKFSALSCKRQAPSPCLLAPRAWPPVLTGAHVIKQGEVGASFFVIASGDVNVEIDGKFIRPRLSLSPISRSILGFTESTLPLGFMLRSTAKALFRKVVRS